MADQELHQWISKVFHEKLENISVKVSGTSEKGDGYLGDIVFATVTGTDCNTKQVEEISLVLKCSKRSEELREKMPVREVFLNEIVLYEKVFPAFRKFEIERGIKEPFDSVPHFYGTFTTDNVEIIVFENLKTRGLDVWNRKLPIPKNYLLTVLREYAKFHAISVAMQDQEPESFDLLLSQLQNVMKLFMESNDMKKLFTVNINEICELLKNDLDNDVIENWKRLLSKCDSILEEMISPSSGVNIICHGDSWCNNFMFQPPTEKQSDPKAVIIDWQISHYTSPAKDVFYLLYGGIGKEDLESLNYFLDEYYETFSRRLEELGSSQSLYSKETFLEDCKKYCNYGLLMTNAIIKICLTDKEDAPDIVDSISNGSDMIETFAKATISNKDEYKERMAYLMKYAFNENVIS